MENIKPLTARQKQTLTFVSEGLMNKEIAYKMGVSESTVKLHMNAILHSLHASNRTKAVMTAMHSGLL